MNYWNLGFVLLLFLMELVNGRQFCGADLANVMQLVCSGRGYNVAFRSEHSPSEKRFKRGIVDECCKRGCSWSTLETYCSPTPSNIQIRKRSDFPSKWQPESSEVQSKIEKFKYDINDMKLEDSDKRKLKISFDNNRMFPNRFNVQRDEKNRQGGQANRGHSLVNKVKRNDIAEEVPPHPKRSSLSFGINWQSGKLEPGKVGEAVENILGSRIPIRHRHRKADIVRKNTKDNMNSQVGTVSPYFLGRTLVLPPSSRKV